MNDTEYKLKYLSIKLIVCSVIFLTLFIGGLMGILNFCETEATTPRTYSYKIIGYEMVLSGGEYCEVANFDTLLSGLAIAIFGIWFLPIGTIKKIRIELKKRKVK